MLKITGKVCFTSDPHYWHRNIIKYSYRPFLADQDRRALEDNGGAWHRGDWKGPTASKWKITDEAVQMMNDALVSETNAVVGRDDTLICLGDFSMNPRKKRKEIERYYKRCQEIRDKINCQNIICVWGNHDAFEGDKDDDRVIRNLFSDAFSQRTVELPILGLTALNHYAMAIWNKSHRGSFHLHGHSHSEAEEWFEKFMPGRRAMDVGVDNAYKLLGKYRPFTEQEIYNFLSNRSGFAIDHHINNDVPVEEMD